MRDKELCERESEALSVLRRNVKGGVVMIIILMLCDRLMVWLGQYSFASSTSLNMWILLLAAFIGFEWMSYRFGRIERQLTRIERASADE